MADWCRISRSALPARACQRNPDACLAISALESLEQPATAEDFVANALRTQRMPDGRDVDRDHRLAELQLERRKDILSREVGAGLHDCVDIVGIELIQHDLDHLARRRVRD